MSTPSPSAPVPSRARGRLAVVLAGTALAAVTLAACSSSGGDASGNPSSTTSGGTATKAAGNSRVATVTVTQANGCTSDRQTLAAGAITFKVTNKDAAGVTEVELLAGQRILGEKENLPPGFSGEFSVNVTAGTYQLYCPGATPEKRPLTVTGKAAGTGDTTVAALLAQGTKGYGNYINTQVTALVAAVAKFDTALHGTDLTAAQKAYIAARPFYERIEPVAESFVIGKDSVDADIDIRAGDVPASQWRGFHRIEKSLFQQKTLKGMGDYGDKLVADVKRLQGLTKNLTYKPTELANGAQGLLDEVAASKITGEEERYSRVDLLDFAGNVEGAEQAFAQLQPALDKIDATLGKTITQRFTALSTLLDKYKTDANPSGYKLYNDLTAADKRGFAAAVKAVQEPLAKVSSKVANA
ncbi:iron uptake system component EfeO [Jatrophihabitans endophyticus]|uniref:Iron uptake system component EfeO n=1 Tax=Jatrophihabitans endophyticus TaxID=1206085 RepID=A0A1M5MDK4_9ACTN|nr:iron uptake system protein EfeO [Jatrophihabitans endophyticus]SHG75316.1 iron uptake system component EfeO [Jatrophihabitans endophyticus]